MTETSIIKFYTYQGSILPEESYWVLVGPSGDWGNSYSIRANKGVAFTKAMISLRMLEEELFSRYTTDSSSARQWSTGSGHQWGWG